MLVHIGIGDAFGAFFESQAPTEMYLWGHLTGVLGYPGGGPATYTDDTQMALAIGDLMLRKDPTRWTSTDVVDAFVSAYRKAPAKGYARGFRQILDSLPKSTPVRVFQSTIIPQSTRNGGAMRAAPLGLLPMKSQVIDIAMMQASVTHATREGMMSAAAAALLTHYFYYRVGPRAEVPDWIADQLQDARWKDIWTKGEVSVQGYETVRAAISCVACANPDMASVLERCVALGGDTDTVAAIAMPAAFFSDQIGNNLSPRLQKDLVGVEDLLAVSRHLRLQYRRPAKKRGFDKMDDEQDTGRGWISFDPNDKS
jgi:ADP-ribosyl-[dinitrogen reductase] hydrolase